MSQSPIDESVWEELFKLEEEAAPGLVKGLVEEFFKNVPESIEKMRVALVKRDAEALGLEAHKLKSACAYLGALEMRDLCARLEKLAASENSTDAKLVVDQLDAEYAQVKARILMRIAA